MRLPRIGSSVDTDRAGALVRLKSALTGVAGSRCPALGHRGLRSGISGAPVKWCGFVYLRAATISAACSLLSVRSAAMDGQYVSRGCALPVSQR